MSKSQKTQDIRLDSPRVQNGLSNDSLGYGHESEVESTRFDTSNDEPKIDGSLYHEIIIQTTQSLADQKNEPLDNKTNIMPDYESGVCGQISTVAGQEHFIVIWRQLSFKVDMSLYDRVANFFDRGSKGTFQNRELQQQQQQQQQQHENFNAINSTDDLIKPSIGSQKFMNLYGTKEVDTRRIIFENLNGYIKSGEISAILGPSGAGKTSLLNAICGKYDNFCGKVQLIGGGSRNMRLSIIPQKDYLIDNLTVRETLLYASKILNTNKEFDHEAPILNIVKMLNLSDCFESSVSYISGGEYKRVSIAQELLKQPDLLILDEPTSGLDSLNCKNLIESLARLIDASRSGSINPIAIVMTIHQPDIEIFHMFDHVYCMARKGRVIYDGHPNDVMEVLNSQLRDSSKYEAAIDRQKCAINPANLLIEIASENIYGQEVIEKLAEYQRATFELEISERNYCCNLPSEQLHEQLNATFNSDRGCSADSNTKSSLSIMAINQIGSNGAAPNQVEKQLERLFVRDERLNSKKDNHGKFWYHTRILARRAFKSTIRDFLMTAVSFTFHLLIPFVMWIVYSERVGNIKACPIIQHDLDLLSMIGDKTFEKVNQIREDMTVGVECMIMFFMTTYSFSLCSIGVVALAFPLNMHTLLKEVRNGWFNLPSFVVGKTIANFPFEVLFPVLSQMLAFALIGMPPSYLQWRFWGATLVMALISMISHSHGLIFGAFFMDSLETAIFMALSSTLPLLVLSGFTAKIKNMPKLFQYLSLFSPYRYAIDALNIIRFGFGICPCNDSTIKYLHSRKPNLSDIPQNMRSLFVYYLANIVEPSYGTTESTSNSPLTTLSANNSDYIFANSVTPTGVGNELSISQANRNLLLSKMESGEIDPFESLANTVVKSFNFGREVTSCKELRSEALMFMGTPTDDYLPYLFLGMITLLIGFKVLLFMIVRYRISRRI